MTNISQFLHPIRDVSLGRIHARSPKPAPRQGCILQSNGFRYISYTLLLFSAIMLNVATITQLIYQPVSDNFTFQLSTTNPDNHTSPDTHHYFNAPDTPLAPLSFQHTSQVRVPVSIVKTENNPFFMLKSCFTSIIHRQFQITQCINSSISTKLEKNGYYIFALRKLLI